MEMKIKKTQEVKSKDKVHTRTLITIEVDGEPMVVAVPPGLTDTTKIKEYLDNFLSGKWREKVAREHKELQEKALKAISKK